jgi:hypothetical protein
MSSNAHDHLSQEAIHPNLPLAPRKRLRSILNLVGPDML